MILDARFYDLIQSLWGGFAQAMRQHGTATSAVPPLLLQLRGRRAKPGGKQRRLIRPSQRLSTAASIWVARSRSGPGRSSVSRRAPPSGWWWPALPAA